MAGKWPPLLNSDQCSACQRDSAEDPTEVSRSESPGAHLSPFREVGCPTALDFRDPKDQLPCAASPHLPHGPEIVDHRPLLTVLQQGRCEFGIWPQRAERWGMILRRTEMPGGDARMQLRRLREKERSCPGRYVPRMTDRPPSQRVQEHPQTPQRRVFEGRHWRTATLCRDLQQPVPPAQFEHGSANSSSSVHRSRRLFLRSRRPPLARSSQSIASFAASILRSSVEAECIFRMCRMPTHRAYVDE